MLPVSLALLLFGKSLNVQDLYVSELVFKEGALSKTVTRRQASEANCGSGKALSETD